MEIAKRGDTIEWTIKDPNPLFTGTHQAEVATVWEEKKEYGVYATYGPDIIPFKDATIIKRKMKANKKDVQARLLRAIEGLEKVLSELEPEDTVQIMMDQENRGGGWRLDLRKDTVFSEIKFNSNVTDQLR